MAISNSPTAKLSTGYDIPMIGFGTSLDGPTDDSAPDPVVVENLVKTALQAGYRHLDCSPAYLDEVAVGKGIAASGIARSEIFITSKLWNTHHDPLDVEPALDATLKDLGIEYVDLYLIHWPSAWAKQTPYTFEPKNPDGSTATVDIPIADTWAAMERLVERGKARSIGVSNFARGRLEGLFETAKIIPAVNQIQLHPYGQSKELVAWCQEKNIHITAWGPLTSKRSTGTNVSAEPELIALAKEAGITPAQLSLSWAVQRGTSVIPSSMNEGRIRANLDIVELSKEVFGKMEALKR